nr:receptor-like protein kinase HSL1 [Ipomoea trifida]
MSPAAPVVGVTISVTGQRRVTNRRPNRGKYERQWKLAGTISIELCHLPLESLNLYENQLEEQIFRYLSGDILSLYAKPIYKNSFVGNSRLCGDIEGFRDERDERKNTGYAWLLRSILVLSKLVLIVGVMWFYWKYMNFKKAKPVIDRSKWSLMLFHKLGFDEYYILDGHDEDNVIGCGLSRKVYKVVLRGGCCEEDHEEFEAS